MKNKGISDFIASAMDKILNSYEHKNFFNKNYKMAQEDFEEEEEEEEEEDTGNIRENIIKLVTRIYPSEKINKTVKSLKKIFNSGEYGLSSEIKYLKILLDQANTEEEKRKEIQLFINKMQDYTGFTEPSGQWEAYRRSNRTRSS